MNCEVHAVIHEHWAVIWYDFFILLRGEKWELPLRTDRHVQCAMGFVVLVLRLAIKGFYSLACFAENIHTLVSIIGSTEYVHSILYKQV
jgi:hypothetical protein